MADTFITLPNGQKVRAESAPDGTLQQVLTIAVADGTLLPGDASGIVTKDTYTDGEVLTDQMGADSVLTFTFSAPVDSVVVQAALPSGTARIDPFGGTPDSATGIPALDSQPVYITLRCTTVKVYAPNGSTVSVWGFRY